MSFEISLAISVSFLHIFSLTFNFLLYLVVKRNAGIMSTNRYAYHMILSEALLNFSQMTCIESGLWFGFSTSAAFLSHWPGFIFATANQILFTFRYYLLVLLVLHRAAIVIHPTWKRHLQNNVSVFISVIWVVLILANSAYFPLGCVRYYDPEPHKWVTNCSSDSLPVDILTATLGYSFTYIPHFTVLVNILIVAYIRYYRHSRAAASGGRSTSGLYRLLIQPIALAIILAIEPLCFYVAHILRLLISMPIFPAVFYRIFDYSMTYSSLFVNFVFYFICNSDIRRLMLKMLKFALKKKATVSSNKMYSRREASTTRNII